MITYPEYKINNQTILQEQFDENYEPTTEEIREYAIYIGIDPERVSYYNEKKIPYKSYCGNIYFLQ